MFIFICISYSYISIFIYLSSLLSLIPFYFIVEDSNYTMLQQLNSLKWHRNQVAALLLVILQHMVMSRQGFIYVNLGDSTSLIAIACSRIYLITSCNRYCDCLVLQSVCLLYFSSKLHLILSKNVTKEASLCVQRCNNKCQGKALPTTTGSNYTNNLFYINMN